MTEEMNLDGLHFEGISGDGLKFETTGPNTNTVTMIDMDPIVALKNVLEHPFDQAVIDCCLPVVRLKPSEEAKKILKDLLAEKFEAPQEYLIPHVGIMRQNTAGPYNHLSQIAALLLLEEWEDPDVMDLLFSFIQGVNTSNNITVSEFCMNMLGKIFANEAIRHPEKLDQLVEFASNGKEDSLLREGAVYGWVKGADAAGLSEEERRSVLAPLIQMDVEAIKANDNAAFSTSAAHHWGFEDMIEEAKEAYKAQTYERPLTSYESLFVHDPFQGKEAPVHYEDYIYVGAQSAEAYMEHGDDGEQMMKEFSLYTPKIWEAYAYIVENQLSPEEAEQYIVSDPELIAEIQKMNAKRQASGHSASKPGSKKESSKKARPKAVKNSLASTKTPGGKKKKKKKSK